VRSGIWRAEHPLGRKTVAARAQAQATGDAPDGRDADAGPLVDLAVRHLVDQQRDDAPAVGDRLEDLAIIPLASALSGMGK